jgi:hypothetical protein
MQIDTNKITSSLDGYKTYITLAVGMVVIIADHFQLLPQTMHDSLKLDDAHWLQNLFTLLLGMTARSAVKKVETAPSAPKS